MRLHRGLSTWVRSACHEAPKSTRRVFHGRHDLCACAEEDQNGSPPVGYEPCMYVHKRYPVTCVRLRDPSCSVGSQTARILATRTAACRYTYAYGQSCRLTTDHVVDYTFIPAKLASGHEPTSPNTTEDTETRWQIRRQRTPPMLATGFKAIVSCIYSMGRATTMGPP